MQADVWNIPKRVIVASYTMLTLRLSIFALSCLAFVGYGFYISAIALSLASLSLYAVSKSMKMLLTYCHVMAAMMWAASAAAFLISGGPIFLVICVSLMAVLDGFFKP